jgi:hypothetical protein
LRRVAIDRGYVGRGWKDGDDYEINETAFVWVSGGLELPSGEVVCDLMVSQIEFRTDERTGSSTPTGGGTLRRHCLHIHRSDWRTLSRASRGDEDNVLSCRDQRVSE